MGVRFTWNSGRFHIADPARPYANWVNLYMFHQFTQDPYADPDVLLMNFCNEHFPESPLAAFNMYKGSFRFVMDVYYNKGELYLHHGTLERRRGTPVSEAQVVNAYNVMKALIDRISDANQYKRDLQKYALVISYLGRIAATGDGSQAGDMRKLDEESYQELSADEWDKW